MLGFCRGTVTFYLAKGQSFHKTSAPSSYYHPRADPQLRLMTGHLSCAHQGPDGRGSLFWLSSD